ncbi:DNA cytosine methyltransferase [aff. Roholtiella sp. LEGE 12411]|uniref:DNA cytosine methyltransferase n=1 Tax=aff. Roholtiella sp. LEGE 12411 TaxID=1828822 RepID=UPI0018827450|nr:DNA cytosine methyltransferase [aff. Roholtiella sp. LEGE 12411]MBE9038183.1 DNA cytosine methyltransferase [aff. Roholtiella sp. LEGE 12411]
MNKPFFLSICSGAGGSSLGAKAVGCDTLGIEIDPPIAELYRTNVGQVLVEDITTLNPYKVELPLLGRSLTTNQLLIVQVSPPCQDYSVANKSAKNSTRADLLYATFHHFEVWQPDIVILENVRAYRYSRVYIDFEKHLRSLGYKCLPLLLNAADFGVPQSRERFISIFTRQGLPLPTITTIHEQNPVGQISLFQELPKHKWIGWYEAIYDLLPTLEPSTLTQKQLCAIQKHGWKTQLVDQQNSTSVQNTYKCRESDQPSFTLGCNSQAKALLVERVGGYDDNKKVRSHQQPSWTIKAGLGSDGKGCNRSSFIDAVLSQADVRRLNTKALARLQTFPDSYQWSGKNSVDVRGIGNAIPCLLMQKLLEQIIGAFT